MADVIFERHYLTSCRVAGARASAIGTLFRLPTEWHRDLEQEALLELWRKRASYDSHRGCWQTFAERVVANRLTSLMRQSCSRKRSSFEERPFESLHGLAAPQAPHELLADVGLVLTHLSHFDRTVALSITDYSPVETSLNLRVSRATVYRAIERIKFAFTEAGFRRIRSDRKGVR